MVKALEELAESLSRLPTIGRKSAWRLALYLVERDEAELHRLATHIDTIRQKVTVCRTCFNYSETETCPVCASPARNHAQICVVERPTDLFAIEKSGHYRGVYHVLGGVLSPINGVTADKLHVADLQRRVEQDHPRELILGLGAGAAGEATSLYLARLFSKANLRITRLARGVPAGMELEYVDQITLNQALNERTDVLYGDLRE
jgi:recombination protein RecR